MNSSKRKFQTLLNGLGSRSSTSVNEVNNGTTAAALASNGQDSQYKRLRTGQTEPGIDFSTHLAKRSIFSRSSKAEMAHNKSGSAPPADLSKEPALQSGLPDSTPKYNPYDRDAFLARLKTYSKLLDWSQKPSRVEAPEWAKRGWVCQKNERVRCDYCYIEIVVKVNSKEVDGVEQQVYVAANIEESLVDKYAQMIVTAHSEDCPWKQRGCGDTIFHLTINNAPTTLKSLRERYDTLCIMSSKLPYMHNIHVRDDYDLDQVLSFLPKNFFSTQVTSVEKDTPLNINRVAIFMALCGWHGDPNFNAKYGSASCSSCFRNLGLWLFKSKKVDEKENAVDPATMNSLDPIIEHREYCPWKSGQSQSGPGKPNQTLLAAWEVIICVLKNNHYLTQSANTNGNTRSRSLTTTDARPKTAATNGHADEDDEKARDEKDKQRQGRLSRIKSLFDIKAGNKLQRTLASEKRDTAI